MTLHENAVAITPRDVSRTLNYPECERLLKDVTGAQRVLLFNQKVRCGPTQWRHLGGSYNTRPTAGP